MVESHRDQNLAAEADGLDKKLTIEEFLASASEMDEGPWEAAWIRAVDRAEAAAQTESIVIYPGHYASDDAPPAEESAVSSLMEILLADALVTAASCGRWQEMRRRTWEHAIALVTKAWGGRMVGECVERFRAALAIFDRRGEVAIDLTQGPGDAACLLFVRTDSLELAEESTEMIACWFVRYLRERRVPFEYLRLAVEEGKSDRPEFESRLSCRVRAMVA